jgi:uncharacterized protein YjbI with pentapeptide repeats
LITSWDDKAIIELWRGSPDKTKALAAIEGLVLRDRSFRFAMLDESSLFAANLAGADLRKASLRNTSLLSATLIGALLQGADLSFAQLQGADLSFAQLQGTSLRFTQLQGANLSSAELPAAGLGGGPLQGANLTHASLQCADLSPAQLQGANLRNAHLQGAYLSSAQLQGADLRDAQLYGADFGPVKRADPDPTVWPKTNLHLSSFAGAETSKVPEQGELKQICAMIETIWDKASAECLQRLCDPSGALDKPAQAVPLETLLREADGAPVLAGSPIPSYTNKLAQYLADELAPKDSAIADGIALRVLYGFGYPDCGGSGFLDSRIS